MAKRRFSDEVLDDVASDILNNIYFAQCGESSDWCKCVRRMKKAEFADIPKMRGTTVDKRALRAMLTKDIASMMRGAGCRTKRRS